MLTIGSWRKSDRCWACKRIISNAAWRRGEVEELDISSMIHEEPHIVVVHKVDACERKTLKQIRIELGIK